MLFENQVKAVIELASLDTFTDLQIAFLEQLTASIGIVLNSIEATMQTEGLLKQSQQLAGELQTQQRELQQTNEQLEQKAQQLAERNVEVERKNQEIEQARRELEEKASELALTSKYKSEFLANMSHELRTPLNSILILGQQLGDNPDGNLSAKQVEFARTIHGAGTDLLNLISDILDLSKIESGTVTVDAEDIFVANVVDALARPFRHEVEARQLSFDVQVDHDLPPTITTDSKRLQQVLKNLLSNAFKFTEKGGVRLRVSLRQGRLESQPSGAQPGAAASWRSKSPTPASAFRRKSRRSSSKPSSRPMRAPAAAMAARAWASRSAANCRVCWAAKSICAARRALGSTFTLYLPLKYAGQRERQPPADPAGVSIRASSITPAPERRGRTDAGRPPHPSSPAIRSCSSSRTIRIMRASSSILRATKASRCWYRCAAPTRWISPSSISRRRSRSMFSCPTCSAGPCSVSSSRTR